MNTFIKIKLFNELNYFEGKCLNSKEQLVHECRFLTMILNKIKRKWDYSCIPISYNRALLTIRYILI